VDINRAWETVTENIKISAKESLVIMTWTNISYGSQRTLKIIGPKETSQILVVTGSTRNIWG
jgi:hypothetical protein